MYRNYDGLQSRFGDQSVRATGANPDHVATFAGLRTSDGAMTVMIVAKTKGIAFDVTVNLSNFNVTGPAQRYQLTSTNTITNLANVAVAANTLTLTVPAQSITLLVIPGNALAAPGQLEATAAGTSAVDLRWSGVADATAYDVLRSAHGGAFSRIATVETTSFRDAFVDPGTTYVYEVQARSAALRSGMSNVDAATTIIPDAADPSQLRIAVDAMRAAAGLPPVRSGEVRDLVTGLNQARAWIGLQPVPAHDLAGDPSRALAVIRSAVE